MLSKSIAAALLVLGFEQPASAADWRLVLSGQESDLGRTMTFVDASSVQRTGDTLLMLVDMRIEKPPVTADASRARLTVHCSERWFAISEASYYVGNRWLKPAPTEARQVAEPGTNMHMLLENICAGRFLSGTVDPVEYSRRAWAR